MKWTLRQMLLFLFHPRQRKRKFDLFAFIIIIKVQLNSAYRPNSDKYHSESFRQILRWFFEHTKTLMIKRSRVAPLGPTIKTTNPNECCYYQVATARTCVNSLKPQRLLRSSFFALENVLLLNDYTWKRKKRKLMANSMCRSTPRPNGFIQECS